MDRFNLEDFKKIQETNAIFSSVKRKDNNLQILEEELERLRKKILNYLINLVDSGENTLSTEISTAVVMLRRLENFISEYADKQSVFHNDTKDYNIFAKELNREAEILLDLVSKL